MIAAPPAVPSDQHLEPANQPPGPVAQPVHAAQAVGSGHRAPPSPPPAGTASDQATALWRKWPNARHIAQTFKARKVAR